MQRMKERIQQSFTFSSLDIYKYKSNSELFQFVDNHIWSLQGVGVYCRHSVRCMKIATLFPIILTVSLNLLQEKMKGKNKLVPRLLGITKESVMRVDEKTKEVIQEWNLTNIKRWAASPKSFTLVSSRTCHWPWAAALREGWLYQGSQFTSQFCFPVLTYSNKVCVVWKNDLMALHSWNSLPFQHVWTHPFAHHLSTTLCTPAVLRHDLLWLHVMPVMS